MRAGHGRTGKFRAVDDGVEGIFPVEIDLLHRLAKRLDTSPALHRWPSVLVLVSAPELAPESVKRSNQGWHRQGLGNTLVARRPAIQRPRRVGNHKVL